MEIPNNMTDWVWVSFVKPRRLATSLKRNFTDRFCQGKQVLEENQCLLLSNLNRLQKYIFIFIRSAYKAFWIHISGLIINCDNKEKVIARATGCGGKSITWVQLSNPTRHAQIRVMSQIRLLINKTRRGWNYSWSLQYYASFSS